MNELCYYFGMPGLLLKAVEAYWNILLLKPIYSDARNIIYTIVMIILHIYGHVV